MTNQTIQLTTTEVPLAKAQRSEPALDWAQMREQATVLVKSGFLPKAVDTPEKAIAIMQTGRELGIGPMQALRSIHIIDGKPVMAAELIAGLVLARSPGALLRVARTSGTECVVQAARAGQEPTEFKWTMEDAQRAGLTNKQNWRNYPRAMLRNRAIAEAARGTFPDCTMGLYDPDELGAITTPTGEIVSAPAQPRGGNSVAHAIMGEDDPDRDESQNPFGRLMGQLTTLEELIAKCSTYDEALTIRVELGSKGKRSKLGEELQDAGPGKRLATADQFKELCKVWARCDRQLAKKEKELAPGVEASFIEGDAYEGAP